MTDSPTPTATGWETYNDTIVRVEQGPEWFAQLLYDPPLWAQQVVPLLIGLVGATTLYALWKVGLPDEALAEITQNIGIIAGVGVATMVLVETGSFGYHVDVLVGWLGGSLVGREVARRVVVPQVWPEIAD
jgi:hypothetical protein